MLRRIVKIIVLVVLLLIATVAVMHFTGFYFDRRDFSNGKEPIWGVSYRQLYAQYLGIDAKETAFAIFDDLKVKHIRLIIPWDEIEAKGQGQFDFSFFDWFVKEAEKRGVKLIMNIGPRTAGWPEFHFPLWVLKLSDSERKGRALLMEREIILRYKNSPSVEMWQVENEPLFNWRQLKEAEKIYGIKLKIPDPEFLKKEVDLAKTLDSRSVIITDSGELSDWREASKAGDYFGPTLYRFVWQRIYKDLGFRLYYGYVLPLGWISPAGYYNKAKNLALDPNEVFISELQAEPWIRNESLINSTPQLQSKIFGVEQFEDNIDFARRAGFPRAYLWGAEWWYYQKVHGNPDLWNAAKKLF